MNVELNSVAARARVHAALGDPNRLAIVDTLLLSDASPSDLAHDLGIPTNLLAHHVNLLVQVGLVLRRRSEGDQRRTYLRLVPETLSGLAAPARRAARRVVFVCTHNSARSQLAAALWAHRSDVPATSAGTTPATRIHPGARRVARRHGIRLADARPVHVDDVVDDDDLVIAVCDLAHEHLHHPIDRRLHWSVPDPARTDTDHAFEAAFADIAGRIDRVAPTITPRSTP
jgi:protein-tyrosine-phosphatase/DNA-binding HxlR family transcriptional regulator